MEKQNLLLITGAIFGIFLLLSLEVEQVYAEATITIITPTGNGFNSATADCTDITAGNDIAWLNCSDTAKLWAIGDSSGSVLANITTSAAGNQLLACLADISCVYLNDPTANRITKYQLSGSSISQQSIYNTGCNSDARFIYDTAGFIWLTCSATDQILRMNPSTMATDTLASTGGTCVSPDFVAYAPIDNIGIIHCLNGGGADTIVSFSRTSSTAISILDTETTTSGTQGIFIDGAHNTIMAPSGSIMSVWTYDSGGLLTLSQSMTGQNIEQCHIEPYAISLSTQILYTMCIAYSAPNAIMTAFLINSTGVFQIFAGAAEFNDANAIGIDVHDGSQSLPVWYISSSTNNGKYIRVDGIRSLTTTNPDAPPDPDDGDDGGGGGNAIDGVCQNGTALECVGGGTTGIITGGEPLINTTSTLCQSLGVCSEDNDDGQTNGSGLILMLATGTLFASILIVTAKKSNYELSSLPKEVWLFLVVGVVGLAFYLEWIPDLIFYGIMIGLAGLLAIGLYTRMDKGGNGG